MKLENRLSNVTIFEKMVKVVEKFHKNGYIHRDIKLAITLL